MVYPDTISVYHKLRTSPVGQPMPSDFVLDCVVLSHNHKRPAARLKEHIVVYDYKAAKRTELPPFVLDWFIETYRLQGEEMIRARAKIWDLIGAVKELEKETWDREDAAEDLGSANRASS
jgi:hypothetical protein